MSQHILMVIDSLARGGAERVTLSLASLFIERGYKVDIIMIYDYINYEIPEGVNVHTLAYEKKILQNFRYHRKLLKTINSLRQYYETDFDLILVHLLKASRLMKGYVHQHLYYVIHNAMSKEMLSGLNSLQRKRKIERMQKKYGEERLIAVSQGVADDLKTVMKIPAKSIQLIYNPVETQKIKLAAKEGNPVEKNRPYIIHVGRFVAQKRHDRLVEVFANSNIEGTLVLVGEGKLRKGIEEKVKHLEIDHKVKFLGALDNPYPAIAGAKLLVLSSDFEGLSMVILEALALGVPVLSTDCPSGPREILDGYIENALVPLGDDKRFSEMMLEQFNHPSHVDSSTLKRFEGAYVIEQYRALMQESL